jgi:mRNA interferase RelE/StbE
MNWRLDFSNQAVKFLKQNNLSDDFVVEKIKLAIRKFQGEDVNVNIKRLAGEWKGFYRIRSGKMRMIISFDFEEAIAYVEVIDWRGNVYK